MLEEQNQAYSATGDKVAVLSDKIENIRVAIERIETTVITRLEHVENILPHFVNKEVYDVDISNIFERFKTIESKPQHLVSGVIMGTGCISVILFLISMIANIGLSIFTLSR